MRNYNSFFKEKRAPHTPPAIGGSSLCAQVSVCPRAVVWVQDTPRALLFASCFKAAVNKLILLLKMQGSNAQCSVTSASSSRWCGNDDDCTRVN